jgi:hypothetical protein
MRFKLLLTGIFMAFIGFNVHAQTNQIVLKVNMTGQTVSPNGVHVAGNFQDWNPSSTPMVDEGNGIYSHTFTADEFANLNFKFINGNDWPFQESVPSSCGLPDGFGGNNRILETGGSDVIYGPYCFGTCNVCPPAVEPITVNVTFRVNMSEQTVSSNGVHIAGNFQDWNPSSTAMVDAGNGIFEYTTAVSANSELQWKFINGNDWPFQEAVPSACGVSDGFGGFQRSFTVGESDIVLDVICFSGCEDCGPIVEPSTVTVLFQVNMSNETVSPQGIHIAGNFQGWNPNGTVMNELGGGIYELSYEVAANSTIEFRFINGSEWADSEIVPADCGVENEFGEFNRVLEIGDSNEIFGPVCFGGCTNCEASIPVMVIFQVDMSNENVASEGVFVAGTFNDWNPTATQLASNGDGTYSAVVFVDANSTLSYKFINGTIWESVPMECGVSDGFGGYNRSLSVANDAVTANLVCYGSCGACIIVPTVAVTFKVDMTNEDVTSLGVYVAGSFNNFNPSGTPMVSEGNGVYSVTVNIQENTSVTYKFLNGNDWPAAEAVPFECGVNDGFGGYNRNLVTNNSDVLLPTICFASCEACIVDNVQEAINSDFTFYPNPANDVINLNGLTPNSDVIIYDVTGKIAFKTRVNASSVTLNVSQLERGMYVIRESTSNKSLRLSIK